MFSVDSLASGSDDVAPMDIFAPRLVCEVLVAAFLAALFLQSGLDKVFDFQGNFTYQRTYFAKTPFRTLIGLLFPILLMMEVVSGVLCAAGAVAALFGEQRVGWWGCAAAAVTIIAIFFGQRIAKDYGAAAGMAPYFIVAILGTLLFAPGALFL